VWEGWWEGVLVDEGVIGRVGAGGGGGGEGDR